ncbi:MAG TPA: hypothetical protein VEB40_12540, partial [Flavipsychrobacter sp.]|nr:hypothetical protein [Flavipsychrobacter sp.]
FADTALGTLQWQGQGNGLKVICDSAASGGPSGKRIGAIGEVLTLADSSYDVVLNVTNNDAGWLRADAFDMSGGSPRLLASQDMPVSGTYTLSFTAESPATHVAVISSKDTSDFTINWASMAKFVTQPINVPFNSVGVPSKYRFGYDTQERIDEVAGVGNHYTALYWEYDPRDVKRWNVDPVSIPGFGGYAVFNSNPIIFVDPLGDYSKVGAWWRNSVNGGRGISYSQVTGEWGYEKGVDGGVSFRDGLTALERKAKVDKFKETHTYTEKFGWIEVATMKVFEPDLFYKWGSSKNFFSKTTYDLANGIYQLPQLATQSINGGFYNLDGTSAIRGSKEHLSNFYNGAMFFMPSGEASIGLAYMKKVNAAQFSHIFKGTTISSASPAMRGTLNRVFNKYLIFNWNDWVPTGSIVNDGLGIVEFANEEKENK